MLGLCWGFGKDARVTIGGLLRRGAGLAAKPEMGFGVVELECG